MHWQIRGISITFTNTGTAGAKTNRVNKVVQAPEITPEQATGFWARLLQDESMQRCSDLERLLTGCEIIAALDDLDLLDDAAR